MGDNLQYAKVVEVMVAEYLLSSMIVTIKYKLGKTRTSFHINSFITMRI